MNHGPPTRLLAFAAAALAAACGGEPATQQQVETAPQAETTGGQEEAERAIDAVLGTMEGQEAAAFPCNVVTREEVQSLTGNFVQAPFHESEEKSQGAVRWTAERCSWVPDADGIGVDLAMSRPEDFASGEVDCVPTEGEPRREGLESLPGLREARWHYQKSFGRATLAVCAQDSLVEVVVDGPMATEEARLFEIARSVAEPALIR